MRLRALIPDPGPLRVLAVATLVNTAGRGLMLATAAIYYTRVVGLSAGTVGIVLTVAALVSLVAAAPLGHLADRFGPREATVAATAASGVVCLALLVAGGFWSLLLVLSLWGLTESASHSARGAVVGGVLAAEARVAGLAYLRAVTNAGIAFGMVFAGIALQADTALAYQGLIAGNGVSFLIAAAICVRLPHVPPVPHSDGPRLTALRDRPYLAVAALNGVLSVHYMVLNVALPLWIVDHTAAPRWLVAFLLILNSAAVVLFQVRVSRGAESTPVAARALRWSGLLLGTACLGYAAGGGGSAWIAASVLVGAGLVHVLGELLQAAGGWGLSYNLAPEGRHGQYQGVFGMGFQIAQMAAPVLVTTLPLTLGGTGWGILAGMFVLTGAAVPAAARWAERTRPAAVVAAA